ncbi:MAG: prepilin-type N-terminal cleavage/methylation domain-containing protein [Deltaproteobacteria bacterium]|nr:prepilin-type N-terminal cleavage/methylation domain-containing protein [Deltaproteobacteria bacterium]
MTIFLQKNQQGFSLVEFLIAAIILSVGLLALINLQLTSIRGNSDSKEMTRAIFLAENRMEQLKNTPYVSLGVGTTQDPNNPINGQGQSGGIFTRSWTIQNYLGSNFMKQITVNVSWTLKGQSHNANYQTVVSR